MSSRLIVVRANWDNEAKVWVAESADLPGLVTEAATIEELNQKLPGLILDLMSDDDDDQDIDVPVEVVASYSRRVTNSRAA
jgi:predicted RNase H-like HicB family nuclease